MLFCLYIFCLFQCSRAVGQLWAEMARHISDSLIIPFNVSDFAFVMDDMAKTLLTDFGDKLTKNGIDTGRCFHTLTINFDPLRSGLLNDGMKQPANLF